ncbi:MAG: HDOD domain-containing protein [Burkholderiaceae bacterium]|nr:HDOD domain-containing protein [Roseateles sp.]MBV8471393.1 HDOD domain-containing protein [Burkholderiaceae bacterium]
MSNATDASAGRSSGGGSLSAGKTLGRFKLLRPIGRGAQAAVWLAHDPRLDRDVALKVLHHQEDSASRDAWLHEARAVARLVHPNIVPVFEADLQNGQAYMAFEFVEGHTLAHRLRDGAMAKSRDAVELMLGVLDALQVAHDAGLVHRDLKPSNILLDTKGRARVMDFGIAARVSEATDAARPRRVVGTPGYLSPEAARGESPTPQMDVFAAAVVLAEMLSGQRLNFSTDPWQAVQRVQDEDLSLPYGVNADVDDALRNIVQRGLARDRRVRWASAKEFHDALAGWLYPAAAVDESQRADSSTLDFLLRRMRHRTDFPAMSESVTRIDRLTQSDNESLNSLSNEILKDVALTHKLLRLVNTAQFSHAGGGTISTVSRAAALIGFAGIRNLALSLILLERMENKAHAQQLREEFLRSLMAGSLARELSTNAKESEETFLCAMLMNLGRLLSEFYFPEEAQQIRRMVRVERKPGAPAQAPVSEAVASTQVLGLSYEQLGLGVARQWGLPDSLQRAMRRPEGEVPTRLIDQAGDRQRWLARAANEVADLILHSDPNEAHGKVMAAAQRYARPLGVSPEVLGQAADVARQRLAEMAQAMEIRLPQHSVAQRLMAPLTPSSEDSLTRHALQPTVVLEHPEEGAELVSAEQVSETLAAGIHDVTNVMVDNFKLNEVLRMILETIYRGLHVQRVVFCLRDPKTETLTGRFGLGQGVDKLAPLFKVPLKPAPGAPVDVFTAICVKGMDTLISDATVPQIASRLPGWFAQYPQAGSFLVLPMQIKGATFAMIYADKPKAGSVVLGEKELSLLRTLRNQAVMAFRQQS